MQLRPRRALHGPNPPLLVRGSQVKLTSEELSAVCQRLPRGKAPGDDGLPYEFYAAFWDRLAPRLLAVLNAAFHSASPHRAAAEHALRAHHAAL